MRALEQGADPKALYYARTALEPGWWQRLLSVFRGSYARKAQGSPLLVAVMDCRIVSRDRYLPPAPSRIALMKMLVRMGSPVNVRATMGVTPLEFAVQNNEYDLAVFLLDHGADVNLIGFADVPLIERTILYPNRRFVLLFLDRGADINVRDRFGERPLDWAEDHGNADYIEILRKRHAKLRSDP